MGPRDRGRKEIKIKEKQRKGKGKVEDCGRWKEKKKRG